MWAEDWGDVCYEIKPNFVIVGRLKPIGARSLAGTHCSQTWAQVWDLKRKEVLIG